MEGGAGGGEGSDLRRGDRKKEERGRNHISWEAHNSNSCKQRHLPTWIVPEACRGWRVAVGGGGASWGRKERPGGAARKWELVGGGDLGSGSGRRGRSGLGIAGAELVRPRADGIYWLYPPTDVSCCGLSRRLPLSSCFSCHESLPITGLKARQGAPISLSL